MKVLIIGGTRFIGPSVVTELLDQGHRPTLLNRGTRPGAVPDGVQLLQFDRDRLQEARREIEGLRPDVVLDMYALTEAHARGLVEVVGDLSARVVVASSCDVYAAFGRVWGTEPGPLQPVPIQEDAELRTSVRPQGAAYDKLAVERIVREGFAERASILRLPAVYGPGDYVARFYRPIKRMVDGRNILMPESELEWRFTHGFVDDVAHALTAGVLSEHANGRVFNVGELSPPTARQRLEALGSELGWRGEVVGVPDQDMPRGVDPSPFPDLTLDWRQELFTDTSAIRAVLGFEEVVSPSQARSRSVEWYLANPPEQEAQRAFDYDLEDQLLGRLERS